MYEALHLLVHTAGLSYTASGSLLYHPQSTDEETRAFLCCVLAQPCLTLPDLVDSSSPGSSLSTGILQARTLE